MPTPGPFDEHVRRVDLTRRRVLQGMLASAGLVVAGTTVSSWTAQRDARAAGALLPPDTLPHPSIPAGTDTIPQIEHVVIYMQENQSFDHYFGSLGRGDGFTYANGSPTNSNVDAGGKTVTVFHEPSTCDTISGDHSWNGTHLSWNHGAMDGFAKVSGDHVMGFYDGTNLPFYHSLASTFPLCDRWFSSVPGPTHPNRRFLQAGTSAGLTVTDINAVLADPIAPNGTIWDRLDAHGITWKDYAIDLWDILLWPGPDVNALLADTVDNRKYFPDFLADCVNGTLPQVSILAPGTQGQYDEGARDVQNGEIYSADIINTVMNSPLWEKTAIFFTYDEHGGGYDHVPPPAAPAPDNIAPILQPGDVPGDFAQYGIRVPGMIISPYAKPNYVSHVVHDHTSILKFLETKWNLPAMTYRDANADDLLDCFDFSAMAFREPPALAAPGLPASGSACDPQPPPPDPPAPTTTTTTSTTTTTVPGSSTTTVPGAPAPAAQPATAIPGVPTYTG